MHARAASQVRARLRLLLVEDSDDDARMVVDALSDGGFEVSFERVETPNGMEAALRAQRWDLIISDHSLPQFNSIAALSLARADAGLSAPFVIVSGAIGEETAVEALQAGADDYVMKDRLERLVPAVSRALKQAALREESRRAVAALEASEARFRHLASHVPGMVYQLVLSPAGALEFVYVSEGAVPLLGVEPAALRADPRVFLGCLHPEDEASFHDSMRTSAAGMAVWNWEGRIQLASNPEVKWINLRAMPARDAAGSVHWDGILTNITLSRTVEMELRHSREDLRELSSHLERAKERERERIARDIHDDLGGTLTALKMSFARLAGRMPAGDEELERGAQAIEHLLDRAIETASRISYDLRPSMLDWGLCAAVEWQAKDFENRLGLACEVTCSEEEVELDDEVAISVFRIVQEALTNIAKHAQATSVHIRLGIGCERLELEIEDDGIGLSAESALNPRSFGIVGMRERCRQIGGSIDIRAGPQGGSVVGLSVPLARTAAAAPALGSSEATP